MRVASWIAKILLGGIALWLMFIGTLVHVEVIDLILHPPKLANDAQDTIVETLGCTSDPCVIKENPGGNVVTFMQAARLIREGAREKIVIDGPCSSACAYFADKARPHVCITTNVVFGFHKGRTGDGDDVYYFDILHSPDIQEWVTKHGGYPQNGLLRMRYKHAKKFWPTCPKQS